MTAIAPTKTTPQEKTAVTAFDIPVLPSSNTTSVANGICFFFLLLTGITVFTSPIRALIPLAICATSLFVAIYRGNKSTKNSITTDTITADTTTPAEEETTTTKGRQEFLEKAATAELTDEELPQLALDLADPNNTAEDLGRLLNNWRPGVISRYLGFCYAQDPARATEAARLLLHLINCPIESKEEKMAELAEIEDESLDWVARALLERTAQAEGWTLNFDAFCAFAAQHARAKPILQALVPIFSFNVLSNEVSEQCITALKNHNLYHWAIPYFDMHKVSIAIRNGKFDADEYTTLALLWNAEKIGVLFLTLIVEEKYDTIEEVLKAAYREDDPEHNMNCLTLFAQDLRDFDDPQVKQAFDVLANTFILEPARARKEAKQPCIDAALRKCINENWTEGQLKYIDTQLQAIETPAPKD